MHESINRRNGAADKTKESLLFAAKNIFSKKGYEGTTVKDLASFAGVNISLVSYHFGGKEGLYKECIQEFGKGKIANLERVLQSPTSQEEFILRLRVFVEELENIFLNDPEVTAIVLAEMDKEKSVIEDVFELQFENLFKKLEDFFQAAIDNKIINSELNPFDLAGLIFGVISQSLRICDFRSRYFSKDSGLQQEKSSVLSTCIELMLKGMINTNPRR